MGKSSYFWVRGSPTKENYLENWQNWQALGKAEGGNSPSWKNLGKNLDKVQRNLYNWPCFEERPELDDS